MATQGRWRLHILASERFKTRAQRTCWSLCFLIHIVLACTPWFCRCGTQAGPRPRFGRTQHETAARYVVVTTRNIQQLTSQRTSDSMVRGYHESWSSTPPNQGSILSWSPLADYEAERSEFP